MTQPPASNQPALPNVVEHVDVDQLRHFVTTIKTAEQQVGENIIRALAHDGTVAVLTTVVMGPNGQQRVISAALDPSMMKQVQEVIVAAQKAREEEEPCIGFHCLIKPKITTGVLEATQPEQKPADKKPADKKPADKKPLDKKPPDKESPDKKPPKK